MNKITLKLSNKQTDPIQHMGIICPKCNTLLFSRARHDFSWCACEEVAIDGGFDYLKTCFRDKIPEKVQLTLLGVTKRELYDDWNRSVHQFGAYSQQQLKTMQVFAMSKNGNDVLGVDTSTTKGRKIDLTGAQAPAKTVVQTKTNMKTLLFSTAVLLAVGDLRQLKPQGFSLYEVTRRLREQTNKGEIAFSDKSIEDVDGIQTFRVVHDEVKAVFNDLFENGVVSNLKKSWDRNGGFFVFVNDSAPATTPAPTPVATPTPASTPTVASSLVTSTAPLPTIHNTDVVVKLLAYVQGIPSGAYRTMKHIQSRFKGIPLSCEEIAKKLVSLGYHVENSTAPFSRQYVRRQ